MYYSEKVKPPSLLEQMIGSLFLLDLITLAALETLAKWSAGDLICEYLVRCVRSASLSRVLCDVVRAMLIAPTRMNESESVSVSE